MDTVQVNIYTAREATTLGLVSPQFLANFLEVSPAKIGSWVMRRSTSGIPEATGFTRRGDGLIPVYDFAAIVEWYTHHNPAPSGHPFSERSPRVQAHPQGSSFATR